MLSPSSRPSDKDVRFVERKAAIDQKPTGVQSPNLQTEEKKKRKEKPTSSAVTDNLKKDKGKMRSPLIISPEEASHTVGNTRYLSVESHFVSCSCCD